MTVRLSPRARVDLLQAESWYEQKADGLGRDFLRAFDDVVQTLSESPRAFPAVLDEGAVRRAVFRRFPFVAFYIFEEGSAVILAILHERRSPERWPLG